MPTHKRKEKGGGGGNTPSQERSITGANQKYLSFSRLCNS